MIAIFDEEYVRIHPLFAPVEPPPSSFALDIIPLARLTPIEPTAAEER